MKCVYSVLKDDFYRVILENQKLYIEDVFGAKELSVNAWECFNALISLFSLKEEWISEECLSPLYKIEFEDGDKVSEYTYKTMVPSNFNFFISFINKLVCEALL